MGEEAEPADIRTVLRCLGDDNALRDKDHIPRIAKRIAGVLLPKEGPTRILEGFANVSLSESSHPKQKWAIACVFHELLMKLSSDKRPSSDAFEHFVSESLRI